jgi:quercetin dioxygenase-like cupin family protein
MSEAQVSKGAIFRPSAITPAERGGGARTYPMVSKRCGSTAMMNGITEFEGGAAIPLHTHNCEEAVMLLEGDAMAEIDGVEQRLVPFELSWIPAEVPHRFRNLSASGKMRIFWTYASVDATRTLVATGDTRRVDAEHGNRG